MKTCLIVDDSMVIRKIARRIVESFDYTVSEAADGSAALMQCAAGMPDLILLDCHMPGMNGIDFLHALSVRALDRRPKVLFCTGEKDDAQIRAAFAAGADDHVIKPFDSDVIGGKLRLLGLA